MVHPMAPFASPYERGVMPAPAKAPLCGPALRPGGRALTGRAVGLGGWQPGARVLDLGCGRGDGLAVLQEQGIETFGLDVRSDALAAARRTKPGCRVVNGRGEALPFASASLDGVLAECSLSVTATPQAVLAEIFRVLKPGGRLVATDVYARSPRVAVPQSLPRCLAGMVGYDMWCATLQRAGLVLDTVEDHSAVLKELLGRIIFEHGSLSPLWGEAVARDTADDPSIDVVRRLRPGFLLLVAVKQDRNQGRAVPGAGPSSGDDGGE